MYWRMILSVMMLWCAAAQAASSSFFLPEGIPLPENKGKEHVWWHGRANFKGQVIAPACTLNMENMYQAIDMGASPVRDLQESFSGPEKKFYLQLRNCELAGKKARVNTGNHVRITFDGAQGETPDKFSLTGQSQGINLQILDRQGYPARAGKAMPPSLLNGHGDRLDYTLRIVRDGKALKAGDYYAVLRFKLDYE